MQPKAASTLLKIATPSIASLLASSAMGTVHVGSGDTIDMTLLDPADSGTSVFEYWTLDGNDTPGFVAGGNWLTNTDFADGTFIVSGYGGFAMANSGVSFAQQGGALQHFSQSQAISAAANWTTYFYHFVSGKTSSPDLSAAQGYFRSQRAGSLASVAFGSDNGSAFIGFRFDNGGTYNYGWAEMTWSNDGEKIHLTIGPSTWSDAGAILAGTTMEVVPEPAEAAAGLGALALGAVGLARWRRNRAVKVA